MKKIITLITLLFMSLLVQAQVKVPASTDAAFNVQFPKAYDVLWKENKLGYEVRFQISDTLKTANYDGEGKWLSTKSFLKEEALPVTVTRAIYNKFENGLLAKICRVENELSVYYEIHVNDADLSFLVKVAPSGKIIRAERL